MKFVAATNNAHKLIEIRRILEPMGHRVVSLRDIGLEIDPEETGETFAENARIKAVEVCLASGRPTIADDSGLCVDALEGAPGVYSARYAGGHGDDKANNQKLLRELEGVEKEKRTARFVSAIALAMPDGRVLEAQGACEGLIGYAESGSGGFGYDPLFYVGEYSFADIAPEEKDAQSHRAVALARLAEALPAFLQG